MSHYDGNIAPMGQGGINKTPKALRERPPCHADKELGNRDDYLIPKRRRREHLPIISHVEAVDEGEEGGWRGLFSEHVWLYGAGERRQARSFQLDRFLRGSVSIRNLICTPTPGTRRLALIVRIGIALSWEHGATNRLKSGSE